MKKLIIFIVFTIITSISYSQDNLSVIFSTFIREPQDTIECDLIIWKKIDDFQYIVRSKHFFNQTMISLSEGNYFIQYIVDDNILYEDNMVIDENPSVAVYNVLYKPIMLKYFDFSRVIHLTPGAIDLATRKDIYIEF